MKEKGTFGAEINHTHMHTCKEAYARMYACTHTCVHAHTNTCTHMHTAHMRALLICVYIRTLLIEQQLEKISSILSKLKYKLYLISNFRNIEI